MSNAREINRAAEVMAQGMGASKAWPVVFEAGSAMTLAAAALEALDRAGYAVVPAEPTDSMLIAGTQVTRDPGYGHCHDAVGSAVYRAMIAASKET